MDMNNTPFENLATLCNVNEEEIKELHKRKISRRKAKICKNVSDITSTYNQAVKHFKTITNVNKIARYNKTTAHNVILAFCRKNLNMQDASRVTELVMNTIN